MSHLYPGTAEPYRAALDAVRGEEAVAVPAADPTVAALRAVSTYILEAEWWVLLRADDEHPYEYDSEQRTPEENVMVADTVYALGLALTYFAAEPARSFPGLAVMQAMYDQLSEDQDLTWEPEQIEVDGVMGTVVGAALTTAGGYVQFTGSPIMSANVWRYQDWGLALPRCKVLQVRSNEDPTKYVLMVDDDYWGRRIQPASFTAPPFAEDFDLGRLLAVAYEYDGERINDQPVNWVYWMRTAEDGLLRGLLPVQGHDPSASPIPPLPPGTLWRNDARTHDCDDLGESGVAHAIVPRYGIFRGLDDKRCSSDANETPLRYVSEWQAVIQGRSKTVGQGGLPVIHIGSSSLTFTVEGSLATHFTVAGVTWDTNMLEPSETHTINFGVPPYDRIPSGVYLWTAWVADLAYDFTCGFVTIREGETAVVTTRCPELRTTPIPFYDKFGGNVIATFDDLEDGGYGGPGMAAILATNPWPDADEVWVDRGSHYLWYDDYWGPVWSQEDVAPTHTIGAGARLHGRFPVFDQYNLGAEPPAIEVYAIDTYGCSVDPAHGAWAYDPATDPHPMGLSGWNCPVCSGELYLRIAGSKYNPIGLSKTLDGGLQTEVLPASGGDLPYSWEAVWGEEQENPLQAILHIAPGTAATVAYKRILKGTQPVSSTNPDGNGYVTAIGTETAPGGGLIPADTLISLTIGGYVHGHVVKWGTQPISEGLTEAKRVGFTHGSHLGHFTEVRMVEGEMAQSALSAPANDGDLVLHVADLSGFNDAPGLIYFRDPSREGGEAQYRYESIDREAGTVTLRNPVSSILPSGTPLANQSYDAATCYTSMSCPYHWGLDTQVEFTLQEITGDVSVLRGMCVACAFQGAVGDGRTFFYSPPIW